MVPESARGCSFPRRVRGPRDESGPMGEPLSPIHNVPAGQGGGGGRRPDEAGVAAAIALEIVSRAHLTVLPVFSKAAARVAGGLAEKNILQDVKERIRIGEVFSQKNRVPVERFRIPGEDWRGKRRISSSRRRMPKSCDS